MSETNENKDKKFELAISLIIVLFAAILAIVDLFGGKYGDDEIIAQNEKSSAYSWYQSKSVKQSLLEGEMQMLTTLIKAGVVNAVDTAGAMIAANEFKEEINKYKKEKKEILLGSAAVGQENWIQEKDGELGKIKGAKEWEAEAELLGKAGDQFDFSVLFLQLCLVFGAIALVVQSQKIKLGFLLLTVAFGIIGIFYAWKAYQIIVLV